MVLKASQVSVLALRLTANVYVISASYTSFWDSLQGLTECCTMCTDVSRAHALPAWQGTEILLLVQCTRGSP